MLDREIEPSWSIIKESYPDAIVFHEARGLYVVKGRDTQVLATEFRIDTHSASTWYGFHEDQALGYMQELAKRGYAVVRATKDGARCVTPPVDRRDEIRRQRKKGKFLAVEPGLLFDERTTVGATSEQWLKRRGYEGLFEDFQRWLLTDDRRSLRDYGELYIYQVGDWYEVDLELTSMLEGHVLLLARAAFATDQKLRCKLVQPKCRRERSYRKMVETVQAAPASLGQARFDGW